MDNFISVSITTYNRKNISKYCLDSIPRGIPKDKHELIVVDNKSTDGTRDLIKEYHKKGIIDKPILNRQNMYLGHAINQALNNRSKNADWCFILSNDHFLMEGFYDNFCTVVDDLDLDYIYCLYLRGMTVKDPGPYIDKVSKNGGKYMLKDKKSTYFGAGLAIRPSIIKKHGIEFDTKKFAPNNVGPWPKMCKRLKRMKLRHAYLAKPCALTQDSDWNNPALKEYYKKTFGERGNIKRWKHFQKHGRFHNPQDYYSGTNYLNDFPKISKGEL